MSIPIDAGEKPGGGVKEEACNNFFKKKWKTWDAK